MKEHVFSTLMTLRSSRKSETKWEFYRRIREAIYDYLLDVFNKKDIKDETFSSKLPKESFMEYGYSARIGTPWGNCSILEQRLWGEQYFSLCVMVPRTNPWCKNATDHTLVTELILETGRQSLNGNDAVVARVAVRSYVEYQPFAGFYKTRKLPRTTPGILDKLVSMDGVMALFEPRHLQNNETVNVSSAPQCFPVRRKYVKVCTVEDVRKFSDHLTDVRRPFPLVVFFGDNWRMCHEANWIADKCWAKCRVWVLQKGAPRLEEILRAAIKGINVESEFMAHNCRILFPNGLYLQTIEAQPEFRINLLWNHHFRKRATIGLQRFYHFNPLGWISSERELVDMIRYEKIKERLASSDVNQKVQAQLVNDAKNERDVLTRQYLQIMRMNKDQMEKLAVKDNMILIERKQKEELQRDSEDLLKESAEAIEQRDELLNQNIQLQQEIAVLRNGFRSGCVVEDSKESSGFTKDDPPETFDQLQWVSKRCFAHLIFADDAWEMMFRKKNASRHVKEVWYMLWALEYTLHRLLFDSANVDIVRKFKDATGYDYSPKDSSDLPKSMDQARNFSFAGKRLRMSHHIKNGNRDATLLRIYFAVDNAENKLIIGSIGDHLPTLATSRQ